MGTDDYDPRGAIHQAAAEQATQRSLGGLAPPPRPRPGAPGPALSAPPPPPASGPPAVEESRPPPAPAPATPPAPARRAAAPKADDQLIGVPRGKLRYLRLYLSGPAAELVEEIRLRSRRPRGVVLMAGVRATYTEIRNSFALPVDPDPGPMGPSRATSRRRIGVERPVLVTASITNDEARGLQTLSEATGLSVSAIVSEAMERSLRNAAELPLP